MFLPKMHSGALNSPLTKRWEKWSLPTAHESAVVPK